ncbi:MAG: 16S rRNA (cytosine(967)-C(5))-methyltransferase RsmB [bacterium]
MTVKKKINPRLVSIYIISRVLESKSYSDILLDYYFKRNQVDLRDRRFITELVHGTLRWKKKLDWILQQAYNDDWKKVPVIIKYVLNIGLYQIMYMDKVPDYASVNETVRIAVQKKGLLWGRVVNGILRRIIRDPEIQEIPVSKNDPVTELSIKWAHPEWLVEKWIKELGVERTNSLCQANNRRPILTVRVNQSRSDSKIVAKKLVSEKISVRKSSLLEEFLIVSRGGNRIINTKLFKIGDITIQDISAGFAPHLLAPKPGEVIVDAASAPGGKATHCADLADDKAIIIACDRHPVRIRKVLENYKRLGFKKIFPVVADAIYLPLKINVDKILLDVPCSGFGDLRRKSEIKLLRDHRYVLDLAKLQKQLINAAASHIKPGGILVYSTCTLLTEENENIVESFLQDNKNFTVEDAKKFVHPAVVTEQGFVKTWPDQHNIDGSFAVRLKKKV